MKQMTKRSPFWKVYLFVTAILLCLAAGGLAVFYDFIHCYELSQPQSAADQFIESIDDEQLQSWIHTATVSLSLLYESSDTAEQALLSEITSIEGAYTYQREYGNPNSATSFRLYRGDTWIARFTLKEGERGRYGFSSWILDSTEAILHQFTSGSLTHTIYAPNEAQVYVNGELIQPEDCVSTANTYAFLSELDASDAVNVTQYTVSGLYKEPELQCILNGEICTAETKEGITSFMLPDSFKKTYTVTVPHSAQLFVNGKPVSHQYRTEEGIAYSYLSVEKTASDLPTHDVYLIGDLLAKPEISCVYNDIPLQIQAEESSFRAEYPASLMYSASILVPQGSVVTVRGQSCDAYRTEEMYPAYPELYENMTSPAVYEKYQFDSLFLPLSDVSVLYEGKLLTVAETSEGKTQTISASYPQCESSEIQNLAMQFAKDYVHYVSYGYNNTAANLASVLQHVEKGSDLYVRLQRSKIGIDYVTPVSSQKYNVLEITECTELPENRVYCSISFDITQYIYNVTRSYTGTLEVNCSQIAGRWYITEMRILSDN